MDTYWLLALAMFVGFSALFGGILAGAMIAHQSGRRVLCGAFALALIPACYFLFVTLGFFGFIPLNFH